jgi:hypothetical protein
MIHVIFVENNHIMGSVVDVATAMSMQERAASLDSPVLRRALSPSTRARHLKSKKKHQAMRRSHPVKH